MIGYIVLPALFFVAAIFVFALLYTQRVNEPVGVCEQCGFATDPLYVYDDSMWCQHCLRDYVQWKADNEGA